MNKLFSVFALLMAFTSQASASPINHLSQRLVQVSFDLQEKINLTNDMSRRQLDGMIRQLENAVSSISATPQGVPCTGIQATVTVWADAYSNREDGSMISGNSKMGRVRPGTPVQFLGGAYRHQIGGALYHKVLSVRFTQGASVNNIQEIVAGASGWIDADSSDLATICPELNDYIHRVYP